MNFESVITKVLLKYHSTASRPPEYQNFHHSRQFNGSNRSRFKFMFHFHMNHLANITIILLYYGNPQWSLLSKITQKWNETRTWRLRRTTLVHPRNESIGTAVIMYKLWRTVRLNPFHLQICIVTLYTVLRTFSKVPTGRICFKIKSYFCKWSFPLLLWPLCVIQGWHCEKKLDAGHSNISFLHVLFYRR